MPPPRSPGTTENGSGITDYIPDWIEEAFTGVYEGVKNVAPEIVQRGADFFGDYSITDNTLTQSQYDFRYRTFPTDLSNDNIGHYMVININVPVRATNGQARGAYTGNEYSQNLLSGEYSKVDTLRFGRAEDVGGSPNSFQNRPFDAEPFSVPRYTRRIRESIAIFMPNNPIIHNTQNDYQEITLSSLGIGMATATAGFVGGAFLGERGGAVVGSVADAAGRNAQNITGLVGYPINPRVEVIFSRSQLRQYVFEFLMAPRNLKESESMKAIIDTLRYHSVPELDPDTAGFTFIPPAELDITFYNKGIENLNIPRINTCVIDRIEVDYAPSGTYATFTNGHPVMARLSLGVREVEILHKRRVLQGF
jgi:hypothetical protein